jgi:hypothetical protein
VKALLFAMSLHVIAKEQEVHRTPNKGTVLQEQSGTYMSLRYIVHTRQELVHGEGKQGNLRSVSLQNGTHVHEFIVRNHDRLTGAA